MTQHNGNGGYSVLKNIQKGRVMRCLGTNRKVLERINGECEGALILAVAFLVPIIRLLQKEKARLYKYSKRHFKTIKRGKVVKRLSSSRCKDESCQ